MRAARTRDAEPAFELAERAPVALTVQVLIDGVLPRSPSRLTVGRGGLGRVDRVRDLRVRRRRRTDRRTTLTLSPRDSDRDLLKRLVPNSGYYGWVVVGVAFLCSALTSPGQSFAIALYLDELMGDLDISRVEISSIYAIATLIAAGFLPSVGALADRISARLFLGGTIFLLGLAMIGFSRVDTTLGLAVAFVAVRLLGQGAIGLGTLTTVVRWFSRYRGRALAIASLGFALGELAFPSAIYALIESVGWRSSLAFFGAVYLLLASPLVAWALRGRHPGETVDGFAASGVVEKNQRFDDRRPDPEYSLQETLRLPAFKRRAVARLFRNPEPRPNQRNRPGRKKRSHGRRATRCGFIGTIHLIVHERAAALRDRLDGSGDSRHDDSAARGSVGFVPVRRDLPQPRGGLSKMSSLDQLAMVSRRGRRSRLRRSYQILGCRGTLTRVSFPSCKSESDKALLPLHVSTRLRSCDPLRRCTFAACVAPDGPRPQKGAL
ncbi:MAG: MFS transporter [Gemmatimonas sp.]|nr:MFS transporter [Gemmatimonas sp.]